MSNQQAQTRMNQQQLRMMLAQREMARRRFLHFLKHRFKSENRPFAENWHHGYLAELVEAIRLRQLKRTIINIPPRFLKSETFSQSMQAWFLGHDPGPRSSFVSASYSATLAERDARVTREIVEAPWYQALFPDTKIKPDKRTANSWETTQNACRFSTGVGGTLTGMGGDHIIVDDPIKPVDANSETIRATANEWMGETMRTRLNDQKEGTITIIMQRLHELDPTGYLLEKMANEGADQYYHVSLENDPPAKSRTYSFGSFSYTRAADELLHPDRVGAEETAAIKAAMGPNYEGQFNQRPVKMTGDFFRVNWVNFLAQKPEEIRRDLVTHVYQAWDFAVTEKETEKDDPDYSVCATMGVDSLGRYVLIDLWRDRVNTGELIEQMILLFDKWKPRVVWGEEGVIEKSIRPWLTRRQNELGKVFYVQGVKPGRADKVERAQSIRAIMAAGNFYVPQSARWWPDLQNELAGFPRGRHDDMIDACSYLGMKIPEMRISKTSAKPVMTKDCMRITGSDLMQEVQRQNMLRKKKPSSLHY